MEFAFVYDIIINFDNIKKEDVFIGINKLLDNNVNRNTFMAYETNITNISDVISDSFNLNFSNYGQISLNCRIKKSGQKPLLIICLMSEKGIFNLENIKEEIILDNINVKYNFRIQPVNITEKCEVKEDGNLIQFAYPIELNYYLNDTINIDIYYYWSFNEHKMLDITLNSDLKNLACYDLENSTQRSIVPKEHFVGKQNGRYSILYLNYLNNSTIIYQLSPIQVTLPKDKDIIIRIKKEENMDVIKIGQKGVLYLIANFEDKNNTFEETHISFDSTIKDENNNKHNASCKLWIPKHKKLRIICKLTENLIIFNIKGYFF